MGSKVKAWRVCKRVGRDIVRASSSLDSVFDQTTLYMERHKHLRCSINTCVVGSRHFWVPR